MADDVRRTDSGIEIKPLYTADDLADWDPDEQLGLPGEAPFTRGVYPSMYRGRLWTMRQYSGFGDARRTNERFHFLLNAGQTGLSCAFDLPTQMGYDSDHPRAEGEVGKVGVAIDSLDDMRALLQGLPLDKVTTSMTINSTAAILLLMYELVAEEQGVDPSRRSPARSRTICLKEYIARGTYVYPPRPSMRIITDIFEYCSSTSPLEHDLDLRLSHPRGRLDRGAGDRLHARQRDRLRAGRRRRRPRRRRLRAAPQLLLERPQPLLRRGRQVPGEPPDVAHDHDRALRREGSEVGDAAVPHPDRRLDAHRAAAGQQRRPRRDPGARRGDGRHPVAPHQRLRRGASRSRPRTRPASRCARSRSSATRPASPTRPTRWPVRTSSSR